MAYVDEKIRKFEEYDTNGNPCGFIIWYKDIMTYDDAVKLFGIPKMEYSRYVRTHNGKHIYKNRWETVDKLGRKSIIFIDTEYKEETLLQ